MFPSGWTANSPNRFVYDAAVFSYDANGTRTYVGVQEGSATEKIGPDETRQVTGNGIRHGIAGMDRTVKYASSMTFTMKELDPELEALLTMGGTTVTAGGITTITPIAAGDVIPKESLIKLPRLTYKLSGTGGYRAVEFDFGYVSEMGELEAEEGSEGTRQITLLARVDPARVGYKTSDPDYRVLYGPDALMVGTP